MRRDSFDLIVNYMFESPSKKELLSTSDIELLQRVEDCYNLKLQNPMYSDLMVRNYLMKKYDVDRNTAIRTINITTQALGNVPASKKNWVKKKADFLLEKAYEAIDAGNLKKGEQLRKLAEAYGIVYNTKQDDEDMLNVKHVLNIDNVIITSDVTQLGVKIPEPSRARVEKMKKKYQIVDDIIDVEYETVKSNDCKG